MKTYITIIALLISLNVCCLYKYVSLKKVSETEKLDTNRYINTTIDHYKLQLGLAHQNNGIQLNNITAMDTLKRVRTFCDIISDLNFGETIICRISDAFCTSCNDAAIKVFKETITKFESLDVIFVCTCQERRFINKFISNYGISGNNICFVEEHTIPADSMGFPYYAYIDRNLQIRNIYMPSKTTKGIDCEQLFAMCKNATAEADEK